MNDTMKERIWQVLVCLHLMPRWRLQAWRIWKLSGNGVDTIRHIRCATGMDLKGAVAEWNKLRGRPTGTAFTQ